METGSKLIERVRALLSDVQHVSEKRMFGSTGFMIRGKLAIAARSDRIMCRIDSARVPQLLKQPGCRPVIMKGRQMKGYVYVDASVVKTKGALATWIHRVLVQNEAITS